MKQRMLTRTVDFVNIKKCHQCVTPAEVGRVVENCILGTSKTTYKNNQITVLMLLEWEKNPEFRKTTNTIMKYEQKTERRS